MKHRLILATSIFISASFALTAAPFTNGSFETGPDPGVFTTLPSGSTAITGWVVGGNGVDYIGSYWQAANGSRSLDLNATDTGSISQTFDTILNMPYMVTFSLAGNPSGAPTVKALTVSAAGTTTPYTFDTTGATTTAMNWSSRTFNFVANSTSTTLTFSSTVAGSFGPALDNVAVAAAIPEPGTSALLLSGLLLGAAGFVRRKRA